MTHPRAWTDAENRKLRDLWGKHIANDIAEKLGRTYWAVKHQAKKLRLPGLRGHRYAPARGQPKGSRIGETLYVSVGFDPDTFRQVLAVAEQDGLSFSRAALQLVEWGLMAE